MENITIVYTLFCLTASPILSIKFLRNPKQRIFGVFLIYFFVGFAWLSFLEIFHPELRNTPYRPFVFRGVMALALLHASLYVLRDWWRNR